MQKNGTESATSANKPEQTKKQTNKKREKLSKNEGSETGEGRTHTVSLSDQRATRDKRDK